MTKAEARRWVYAILSTESLEAIVDAGLECGDVPIPMEDLKLIHEAAGEVSESFHIKATQRVVDAWVDNRYPAISKDKIQPRTRADLAEEAMLKMIPVKEWDIAPETARDLAISEAQKGSPTGIAHLKEGWVVVQPFAGQDPRIIWEEHPLK